MNRVIYVLLAMAVLGGIALSSSIVSADNDSVVDEINITVPVSCTISGTGMNTHNANINNGIYTPDIGTTTLHAFCNDSEGFAIYAAGYTGNEVGGTNSNKLVGTAASNNATIETGLATTAGNPDISNWAMKLAITQDSGDTTGTNAFTIDSAPNVLNGENASFSSYHVVPNEYTKVAHKDSNTDMTASTGGVKLTTTYAAYISKTQPADTYSGQVIYTLVHPASAAAPIFLNPNADDISEVTYMQQFAIVGDANRQAIIDSMVPEQQYTLVDSRDGKSYTIAKYHAGVDTRKDLYMQAAEIYALSCDAGACDMAFYAELPNDAWRTYAESCVVTNNDVVCSESLIPEAYDVWMTQNLDLDIDASKTYTNEDTDIGYNSRTGEYENATWTPIRSTYQATSTQIHRWCEGGDWTYLSEYNSGWCSANETPESYNPGDLYWNLAIDNNAADWEEYYSGCDFSTSTISCDQTLNPISTYTGSTGIPQYHLGNYYNLAAAIATNDSSIYVNDPVEQSICPAGWTLPRDGFEDDTVYALWNEYGYDGYDENYDISTLWSSPLYYSLGGAFDGIVGSIGYTGVFRSAGFEAAYINTEYVSAQTDIERAAGLSIRCVARPVVCPNIQEERPCDPCV